MTAQVHVADIVSYLVKAGWHRQPEGWRGASIWTDDEGREVLVPAHGDVGDSALRVRDIVDVLSVAEQRSRDEIVREIESALIDNQFYRIFPEEVPNGETTLAEGLDALRGVHDLVDAAARAAATNSSLASPGRASHDAGDLLRRVRLCPARSGSFLLTVGVPADQPLGRRVGQLLRDTVLAVEAASSAGTDDRSTLDDLVTVGVSAEMCTAIGRLAGAYGQQPFEISFRWARDVPAPPSATTVRFEAGTGEVIRAMADRLSQSGAEIVTALGQPDELPAAEDEVTITGVVEGLHDDSTGEDRWRVQVRGELLTTPDQPVSRRIVWVRFGDGQTYDRAIAAHRQRARVRARGTLSRAGRRLELRTDSNRFELLD